MPGEESLLSCQDVLVCKTCLAQNCSVEEMLKQGEDVLEKVEKFCYLGYMIRFMVDPLM